MPHGLTLFLQCQHFFYQFRNLIMRGLFGGIPKVNAADLQFFPFFAAKVCLAQDASQQIFADLTLMWIGKNKPQLSLD
jgi:hypothetical protein